MGGVQRIAVGGWQIEETAFGHRWVLRCQLGFVLADVVEHSAGYNWRALPDGECRMRRGDKPTLNLACAAAEQVLASVSTDPG